MLLAALDRELLQYPTDEELVLDFEGVEKVSYSFADEFVATLMQRSLREGERIARLEGMSPVVERVVESTLRRYEIAIPELVG
ncbi:MAG TPA: DUF4325 domain-containing protein [Solirubrobacteraceae bacterium]|jgi:anti-anti-sigma regulatory factor|nr:DUF4325 domain-containing protein [Solirubrobacteraceae bacterium]